VGEADTDEAELMGDAADSALAHFWGYSYGGKPQRKPTFQSGSGSGFWRTASGERIAMTEMTDAHLANALRKCEETGNTGKAKDLRREIERRKAGGPN
jgi:hypothetical protein